MKQEVMSFDVAAYPGEAKLPVDDIIMTILDRGRITKDDIQLIWGLNEDQYAQLKERLRNEKLLEPGSRRSGGFIARFNRKEKAIVEADIPTPHFRSDAEAAAAARIVELLSYGDLEELLGELKYSIRRARQILTAVDRRGSKAELAAALLIKHGVDLFSDTEVRERLSKRAKVRAPSRWHPGKSGALRFVKAMQFPEEYAGIPAEEAPSDFEYLEGRVDLKALQPFQLEVQEKLKAVLEKVAGRAIVSLPTGGGKTRVAVDTIRDWLTVRHATSGNGEGNVVLWLAHTDELCEQATQCFREVWQGSSNICPLMLFRFWGGYTRNLDDYREELLTIVQRPAVLVSTPQRMLNLLEGRVTGGEPIREILLRLVGLVVIDEAHRAAAPTYRELIKAFAKGEQNPAIVGLTATPFRSEYDIKNPLAGTEDLAKLFRTIIDPEKTLGAEPRVALQEQGYLARPIFDTAIQSQVSMKPPEGVETENPSEDDIEKIDYALKIRADKPQRRLRAFQRIQQLCRDPKALIIYFGPSVEDAECMAFLLRQQGVAAAFVCGATRDVTRRKVIGEFKSGKIQVLCNCEVLTTGFDAPKVTHVVMARPTVSQVLYEQMVGRGLRGVRFGGTETCHIIDVEDNYKASRPEMGYKRFREIWARTR